MERKRGERERKRGEREEEGGAGGQVSDGQLILRHKF